MRKIILFIMLFFAVPALAFASPQSPEARLAAEEYLAQAKVLIAEGKAQEAWPMLIKLISEYPESIEINNLMAEAAFATGRFNQAIAALERMVNLYPQSAKLHLTLAKAYARAGDEESATSELNVAEALEPGILSQDIKNNLESAAKAEQKRYDRFKATGRLAMGILWDSNPTGGLDKLDVDVGGWVFTLDDDAGKKPSWGEYMTGSLNWGIQLSENGPFYIAGDIGFYGKKYDRDLPSNRTFKWGRAAIGPRYLSQRAMFDLRYKAEDAVLEPKDCLSISGADATWVYGILPRLQFIARGGVDARNYWDNDDRNGTYWNYGSYLRWIMGNGDYSLMAGGRLLGAKARIERWSYDGWELSGKFDMTFFKKLDLSPYISFREYKYHRPATLISEILGEEKRRDHMLSAGINAVWHWNNWLATEIGWEYTKNHSSSQFYRYNQQQFNMGMVLSF